MKTYLGIEIGDNGMKLAVCSGETIKSFKLVPWPSNMIVNGAVSSWDEMADYIKHKLKELGIGYKDVAMVLPESIAYVRRFTLPYMTINQLMFNLPYEFQDFIGADKDEYIFDYALLDVTEEEEHGQFVKKMDIMASAISKQTLEQYSNLFKKAGLRLKIAAPESSAYQNLIRKHIEHVPTDTVKDYAILHLGHSAVSLRIFTNGKYETGREMGYGLNKALPHLPTTINPSYVLNGDTEQVTAITIDSEEMLSLYNQIALDVMRVINFFVYNYPANSLEALYCCGIGTQIEPLMERLSNSIELKVKPLNELFPMIQDKEALTLGAAAIGIVWS